MSDLGEFSYQSSMRSFFLNFHSLIGAILKGKASWLDDPCCSTPIINGNVTFRTIARRIASMVFPTVPKYILTNIENLPARDWLTAGAIGRIFDIAITKAELGTIVVKAFLSNLSSAA